MKHQCRSGEDLALVLDLAPTDPLRRECDACPRCGSLLLSMQSFLEDEVELERDESAALDRRLTLALGHAARKGAARSRRRSPRALVAGLGAVAAVAALVLLLWPDPTGKPEDPSGRFRGQDEDRVASSPELRLEVEVGSGQLRWNPVAGATTYSVDVFEVGLDTVLVVADLDETSLDLQQALGQRIPRPGGEGLLVQVRAIHAGRTLATSNLRAWPPGSP